MARKLRLLLAGGWYHVVNRGNRREPIFRTDDDRRRFLSRLGELPERFGLEVHAYVLMDNHYHLLVRTPDTNLSEAVRWLQVSYSGAFNWAHGFRGHVFQGRFTSILIETLSGVVEVARYLHLNPVRIEGLALGKADQRRARVAGVEDPGPEVVRRRLAVLDGCRWSSWRTYGMGEAAPAWLTVGVIAGGCGGRNPREQRRALREYTEAPVRQGRLDRPWDRVVAGVVLGTAEYAKRVLGTAKMGARSEDAKSRGLQGLGRMPWPEILRIAEEVGGRSWETSLRQHGDWMRDGVLHVATRYLGYRLAEVVREMSGLDYRAAAQGVRRFARQLAKSGERREFVDALRERCREWGGKCRK